MFERRQGCSLHMHRKAKVGVTMQRNLSWILVALATAGWTSTRPPSPARDLDARSLLAAAKPEHEHYYVMLFGSQLPLQIPRYTHTWATMVKTTEVPGAPCQVTEVQTISWMPATLEIHPFRCWVESGTNLDLCTTIEEVLRHRERVSLWGPYETWQGLYRRFSVQKAFLDAGLIGYQCTDEFGEAARTGNGSNCFHALSDMDPQFDRQQYPLLFYGDAAAKNIVRQLFTRPILIHPQQTHDWLISAIGLDHYPIERRQYRGPAREFSLEAMQEEIANPTQPRRRLLP
jgi:hypothetical protein